MAIAKDECHFLQLLMTIVLVLVQPWNANAFNISKPGCADKCGDIDIPYPFGMGTSCYFDDNFEIDCIGSNSSSSPKAVLKKLNLEVFEIDLPGRSAWIGINNPIIASSPNCTASGTASPLVNLTGTTFYFSASNNKFGATGCDNQALLLGSQGSDSVGCSSKCSASKGIGECCTSTLPTTLKSFNASFAGVGDDTGVCKYAVVADYRWFDNNPSTACTTKIQEFDTVPAWLEWGLLNSSAFATSLAQQAINNGSFECIGYDYDDGSIIQLCKCNTGFEGNPYLQNACQDINECDDPSTVCAGTCINGYGNYTCQAPKTRSVTHVVIIVICPVVGVLLLVLAIWAVFVLIDRRKKWKFHVQNGGLKLKNVGDGEHQIRIYKLKDLKISKGKSSKDKQLGEGGQGAVFMGTLHNGTQVAIKKCKKFEAVNDKGIRSAPEGEDMEMSTFVNEVEVLSKTIHRNIIKLLGCCLESEAPLLVYEFAVNGDLSNNLHGDQNNRDSTLSWEYRLRIATEVAGALSYLHFSAENPIYHRDIKSANILLDNTYRAKLADFGISKSIEIHQNRVNTDLQGSGGYMDPEFLDSSQYTDKCDVYSFGVVLVELLTGRKALFSLSAEAGGKIIVLAEHFKSLDDKQLKSFLDARVKQSGKDKEVEAVAKLARKCLHSNGSERPDMKEVATELEKIKKMQHTPHAQVIEVIEDSYEI